MQIDIDFDVFKSLTALRKSEGDSYNAVIRRLLKLPETNALAAFSEVPRPRGVVGPVNALAAAADNLMPIVRRNALAHVAGGVWYGNTHFPDGTQFRATYKGKTFEAQIRDGHWVDSDGVVRTSPSDAASSISGTNVNGWRFWFAKRPNDAEWHRMDAYKQ